MAFFDTELKGGHVISGISADTTLIQDAIGEKVQTQTASYFASPARKDKYVA